MVGIKVLSDLLIGIVGVLAALSIPEEFELIPWWDIFGVSPTPFAQAVERTFKHPKYSSIVLDF